MPNPLSHCLFQEYPPTQLYQQEIKAVYQQEVLKIECRNTQGRRAVEVVRTKFKDYTYSLNDLELPQRPSNDNQNNLTKVKAAWRYLDVHDVGRSAVAKRRNVHIRARLMRGRGEGGGEGEDGDSSGGEGDGGSSGGKGGGGSDGKGGGGSGGKDGGGGGGGDNGDDEGGGSGDRNSGDDRNESVGDGWDESSNNESGNWGKINSSNSDNN
ncbi:hypothetical protein C1645_837481 [Glomus cerebriforme]|uniref:Uncharacterized protein n=1 Tax=Glomus cerebriforme TaxID=658196 RepID=A0A397S6L3_9GLOM|nr:hypothetical protein C1645_837481 [Glomus cerebriforme]